MRLFGLRRIKKKPTWFWGMGSWTRANAELCLLATKGKPKRLSASVHSIMDYPIMEHSRKPKQTRKRIIELCGDLPRIELFARQRARGWDAWGDEIDNSKEVLKRRYVVTEEQKEKVEKFKQEALDFGVSFECEKINAFLSYDDCKRQRLKASHPTCARCKGPVVKPQPKSNVVAVVRYKGK